MNCFNENDKYFKLIPSFIKNKIVAKYLFKDIIKYHTRFFKAYLRADDCFIADVCRGLMPRRFKTHSDRVIYEEDQEIAEMYFILTGFIGIAFNSY